MLSVVTWGRPIRFPFALAFAIPERTRARIRNNAFMIHNHIQLESVEPDRAVFRLEIRPESRNVYGMVHGGAIYTLADNATGSAAHTDGRHYVTQNGSLHFLKNQEEGIIRAVAQVRHRGRSTVLVDVDVVGADDRLLAAGEFSFFCIDRAGEAG